MLAYACCSLSFLFICRLDLQQLPLTLITILLRGRVDQCTVPPCSFRISLSLVLVALALVVGCAFVLRVYLAPLQVIRYQLDAGPLDTAANRKGVRSGYVDVRVALSVHGPVEYPRAVQLQHANRALRKSTLVFLSLAQAGAASQLARACSYMRSRCLCSRSWRVFLRTTNFFINGCAHILFISADAISHNTNTTTTLDVHAGSTRRQP